MKKMNRREFLTLTGAALAMMARTSRTSRSTHQQGSRAGGSHQQGLEGKV